MTFHLTTTQTARKPHQCQSCWRVIEPGEKYARAVTFDGGAATYKECRHCSALASLWKLFEWTHWDGYGREDFQEYGSDVARTDTMRDARWYVQWKRQWRRRDGTLYPVPTWPDDAEAA